MHRIFENIMDIRCPSFKVLWGADEPSSSAKKSGSCPDELDHVKRSKLAVLLQQRNKIANHLLLVRGSNRPKNNLSLYFPRVLSYPAEKRKTIIIIRHYIEKAPPSDGWDNYFFCKVVCFLSFNFAQIYGC